MYILYVTYIIYIYIYIQLGDFVYRFIAIEQLRLGREDKLRVLISSEQVYFLGRSDPDRDNIVLQVTYEELYHCRSFPYG